MAGTTRHRYKELRLGQLRAFCECVRQKSFTAAAQALNVSQPAVWEQVRGLERRYRETEFRRPASQTEFGNQKTQAARLA